MLGATTTVMLSSVAGGWPFLPYGTDDAPGLLPFELITIALWGVLAVVTLMARRGEGRGTGLSIATTLLFATTLAGFTLSSGPFSGLGWIAYLGGAVVGYVLFPRWVALLGIVLYAGLVIVGAWVLGAHAWSALDQISPPRYFVALDSAEVLRGSVAALALFTLTFSVIAFIVDRWRDREASYQRLASTDALTGLTNRRKFLEVATRELARARRYNTPLALVIADLDHFKEVNDHHGHQVGDQALAHAARVLAGAVRDVDVISRHGGEEFAILLPMTDAEGAFEVAERCCRRLADSPLEVPGVGPIEVTVSLGVAAGQGEDVGTLDDLLQRADAALYRAKAGGRDRVELAS
jgi:diguanylate cyclase (GGDEF)-like protein